MQARTRILIGVTLVALGAGAVALGYAGGESNVRYVEDLLASPERHGRGSYVLMGVPQPESVPVTGAQGVEMGDNPLWADTVASTVRWTDDAGATWYSTRSVTVHADGLRAQWSYRNETRRLPSDADLAFPAATANWTTAGTRAFTVQAFDDGDGDTPRVWALYAGPVKDPMQPKPSQFTGRLLSALPDGSPLPDGALLYEVEEYKAGCSSKFLPPEETARQAADASGSPSPGPRGF